MFELRGVSKAYAGIPALAPTDLILEAGRTTVLIGPSGCGKSTLLRLLIGLVQPDTGTIDFEGNRLTPASALLLRRRMGYVIQDGGLFPHLTARGNAGLMARYLGWSDRQIDERLAQLVDLTQLPPESMRRYPIELSGGQRQRVCLMRALMLDPDVLLLDEPMGALDAMIRAELQADLRRIFRSWGKTVVMVTHDLGEAAFFGDVIVLVRDGRIVQQGSLDDLVHRPTETFVTRFINAQRSPLAALAGDPT